MARPTPSAFNLWIVYGIAHFGKSLMWAASGIVFAFFLTEVASIRPELMGTIIGVSLLAQAVLDLVVGRVLRKSVQSHQRAAAAQLRGAILAALGFVLFSCAGLISRELSPAYAFATLLLFRFGCSLYDVPQNAFMAFIARDDSTRARYGAMRYVMSGVAALVMTLIITPLIRNADQESAAVHFAQFSMAVALISIMCSALLSAIARRHKSEAIMVSAENSTDADTTLPPSRLFTLIFIGVLLAIFALNLSASVFSNLEAYFVAYTLDNTHAAALFLVAVAIGQITAQPFWAWASSRIGLERVFFAASALYLTVGLLFLGFGSAGGSTTLFVASLYGAAYGGAAMSVWSLLAKSTASSPGRTTQQYGIFTCCSKLAQSTAIVIVGLALTSFDYRSSGHGGLQLQQMMGIAVVIGGVFALVLFASGLLKSKQS